MITINNMASVTHFNLSAYCDISNFDDADYLKEQHLIHKSKNGYNIYKYDKTFINPETYGTLGMFRSVCVKDGKVVCIAPPKSHPISTFKEKYTSAEDFNDLIFEEFVEGTMINVYYADGDWQLNTRSNRS